MIKYIDLYKNSEFQGYVEFNQILEYMKEYEILANQTCKLLDWDEVILYAIYTYDLKDESLISADFMNLRLTYTKYIEIASMLPANCRPYFKMNTKEKEKYDD